MSTVSPDNESNDGEVVVYGYAPRRLDTSTSSMIFDGFINEIDWITSDLESFNEDYPDVEVKGRSATFIDDVWELFRACIDALEADLSAYRSALGWTVLFGDATLGADMALAAQTKKIQIGDGAPGGKSIVHALHDIEAPPVQVNSNGYVEFAPLQDTSA